MCDCKKDIAKTDDYVTSWRAWVEVNNEIKEYNSIDNCFCDIPNDSFQAMRLWYKDGGGRFISGHDYYFFCEHKNGVIFGQTNKESDLDKYENAIIKSGRHIPDGMMKEVDIRMNNSTNPLYGN